MIGRVRFIHPLDIGYRYKIQIVGATIEVMSCGTHDVYKLDDLVFCDSPEYEDSRVPVRRVTNQDIWDALAGVDDWDTPTEELKSPPKVVPEKIVAESKKKVVSRKVSEPEKEEQKSALEKNKLFIECFERGEFVAAMHWLLLGADVDCGVGEKSNTLLLQSVSQNRLIATGFLLAVGAHPSSKNAKGVSANSFAREHSARVHVAVKSLLEEEMKLLKSKRKNPKDYQQNSGERANIFLDVPDAPTQNQDSSSNNSTSVGDAQFLQDMRSDMNDASRDWGYMAREDNGFGGYPGMDDHGDESFP